MEIDKRKHLGSLDDSMVIRKIVCTLERVPSIADISFVFRLKWRPPSYAICILFYGSPIVASIRIRCLPEEIS